MFYHEVCTFTGRYQHVHWHSDKNRPESFVRTCVSINWSVASNILDTIRIQSPYPPQDNVSCLPWYLGVVYIIDYLPWRRENYWLLEQDAPKQLSFLTVCKMHATIDFVVNFQQ